MFETCSSVPVYFKWFSYLSWFRYGNEALLINQWADVSAIACTRSNATCPKTGHMVLQTFNFKEVSIKCDTKKINVKIIQFNSLILQDDFKMDVWNLVALIVAFRVLAYFALLSKTYRTH